MTSYILLFAFTLATGEVLHSEQPATHLHAYRPIHSVEECERAAAVREARMNAGFVDHPGPVSSVTIHCRKAKPAKKRRKGK